MYAYLQDKPLPKSYYGRSKRDYWDVVENTRKFGSWKKGKEIFQLDQFLGRYHVTFCCHNFGHIINLAYLLQVIFWYFKLSSIVEIAQPQPRMCSWWLFVVPRQWDEGSEWSGSNRRNHHLHANQHFWSRYTSTLSLLYICRCYKWICLVWFVGW